MKTIGRVGVRTVRSALGRRGSPGGSVKGPGGSSTVAVAVMLLLCGSVSAAPPAGDASQADRGAARPVVKTQGATAAETGKEPVSKKRQAAKAMLAAAEEVVKALETRGKFRPQTPRFLLEHLDWHCKAMEATLKLTDVGEQRIAAIRRYVAACKTCIARIKARLRLDATPATVAVAEHRLAEAQRVLGRALERHGSAEEKQEAKTARIQAAKAMLAAAEEGLKAWQAHRKSSAQRPDVLLVQQEWHRRVMEAKLKLTDVAEQRVAAIRRYIAHCKTCIEQLKSRLTVDATHRAVAAAERRLADAQHLLARALGGDGSAGENAKAKTARIQAAKANLISCRKRLDRLVARSSLDSTNDQMAAGRYRVAEAEYRLAELEAGP